MDGTARYENNIEDCDGVGHPTLATHFATSTVLAGVAVAFVGLNLAIFPGEAGLAGTRITALASVGARGVILTWPVIGAIVQV